MHKQLREQFKQLLNRISEMERENNRALVYQTDRVFLALEYLKAALQSGTGMKNVPGAG